MFVGYENFSTFFVDADDIAASDVGGEFACFPNELKPHFQVPDPWFAGSACSGDFIVVAEFSELEGPVPRLIIPHNGKFIHFSLDTFIVRLMSVDHQHVQGTNFNISEDAHVILTQSEHGLYAYVHHFTLYDSTARGFVRPFCLAYVTPDYSKLMNFYEELHAEFSTATQRFKAGNHMLFFRDMTHKLSDLLFTKEKLMENTAFSAELESPVKSSSVSEKSLSVAEVEQAISDVHRILEIVSEQIEKPGTASTHTQCQTEPTATPLDSNNFKFALRLQQDDDQPHNIGDDCNVGLHDHKSYKPQLVKSLKQTVPKQLRTLEELCQCGTSSGLHVLETFHKYFSRDSVTLLIEREDIRRLEPSCSLLTIGRLFHVNFLAGLQSSGANCQSLPQHSCTMCLHSPSIPHTSISQPKSTNSPSHLSAVFQCLDLEPSAILMKSSTVRKKMAGGVGTCSSNTDESDASCHRRPTTLDVHTADIEPTSSSLVSVADHVEHLTDTAMGFGLLHFVWQFAATPHILFCLLIGRPVIVVGCTYSEKQIRAIVNALWTFVPGHSRRHCRVLPWSTAPLSLADLQTVKLCGLALPDKKTIMSVISKKIQSYVTILNIDKKTLWSPKYTGSLLTEIVNVKHRFTSDSTYVSYIHCKLFEMAMKAYVCYHRLTDGKCRSGEQRISDVAAIKASADNCSKLHLAEDDLLIVNYLVEVVMKQQSQHLSTRDSDGAEDLRHLGHLRCYSFNL